MAVKINKIVFLPVLGILLLGLLSLLITNELIRAFFLLLLLFSPPLFQVVVALSIITDLSATEVRCRTQSL